jgi:protein-disulfide isomerase
VRRLFGMIGGLLLAAVCVTGAARAEDAAPMADRFVGKADAPVTIYEYASLTCTHCAEFQRDTLPKLKAAYVDTGKVKIVYRDFPLDRYALKASLMTYCAPEDRYFALVDLIYKQLGVWAHGAEPEKGLAQLGKLAGLSQEKIDACWNDKALTDRILARRMEGEKKFGIEATPTFVFNDGAAKIQGADSFEAFAKVIDGLLPKQ